LVAEVGELDECLDAGNIEFFKAIAGMCAIAFFAKNFSYNSHEFLQLKVAFVAQLITLEIPESLARKVQDFARLTDRSIEAVVLEWLDRASTDLAVESLSDPQVSTLCDSELSSEQQLRLSELLEHNRESTLTQLQREELDQLMQIYRLGLVRKAQALKVAVDRGLRPALS
jgi:hypothetical protein